MGRYETSLYSLATCNIGDLEKYKLQELVYGLTQEIPNGPWRNPEIVGKGGYALVVKANSDLFDKCAIKFSLPIAIKQEEKKRNIFRFLIGSQEKIDIKTEFEQRFKRGAQIQKWVHSVVKEKSLWAFGYVPEVHIVPNLDSKLHYVMEYIDGPNILSWSKNQTGFELIISTYEKLLNFVNKAMHDYACVHRDLSPDNILVANNTPVVIDFGLAKVINAQDDDITDVRTIMGKEKWMSPKQALLTKHASFQDDIYTLGLVFWSIVCKAIPPIPLGKKRSECTTWEIFPPDFLPSEISCFKDWYEKMSNDDPQQRYLTLDTAIEGFERTVTQWKKQMNTTVVNKYTIGRSKGKTDWDAIDVDGPYADIAKKILSAIEDFLWH